MFGDVGSCVASELVSDVALVRHVLGSMWQASHATKQRSYVALHLVCNVAVVQRVSACRIHEADRSLTLGLCAMFPGQRGRRAAHATEARSLSDGHGCADVVFTGCLQG